MKKLKNWRLQSKEERRFKQGHPWVYSNELQESPKGIEPGEVVELCDSGGAFLAYGFGNPGSLIAFRTLSRVQLDKEMTENFTEEFICEDFFSVLIPAAIDRALKMRLSWYTRSQSFRLVYGEADSLPGLIIDRFVAHAGSANSAVVYVVQPHSAGMDRYLDFVLKGLAQVSKNLEDPANTLAVLRRDAGSREREGLAKIECEVRKLSSNEKIDAPESLRAFAFAVPGLEGKEVSLKADLVSGQKTGFFFDQLQNIRITQSLLAQKLNIEKKSHPHKILDLCSYVGQWSVHLSQVFSLRKNASVEITCVDSSEPALKLAEQNVLHAASTTTESKISFKKVRADVLEPLPMLASRAYDVVIADPPAFIKNRKSIPQGKHAYAGLFATAIDRTAPGGLVVCCSCSQLLSQEDMIEVLAKASRKAGRVVRWIAQGSPSVDHFNLFEFREGHYLKCWVGQVE